MSEIPQSSDLGIIFRDSIKECYVYLRSSKRVIFLQSKKGSILVAANYASLLTLIVCRILERMLRDKFMDFFLVINNLISTKQHGFVRKKGCVTNLLETLDLISRKLTDGECVDLVFID